MSKFFERQGWHALALAMLLAAAWWYASLGRLQGSFLGLSANGWYWLAISIAIVHQVYVMLVWRAQLHYGWVSRTFGDGGFKAYGVGFMVLFASRPLTVLGLAIATAGTLPWPPPLLWALTLVCAGFTVWLGYSVAHFFGIERALGGDHFYPEKYRKGGYVKHGIYKYFDNAMYSAGFLALWMIAFAFGSEAALAAVIFNHIYVWVHFYTTEQPDMQRIYGS